MDWREASLSDLSGVVPERRYRYAENERAKQRGRAVSNCWPRKYKRNTAQPLTRTSYTMPPAEKAHIALVAVVSALLIFKATKLVTKKPPLLKDLKDVASYADGRQLSDSEYDIIIVGGGESLFVYLGP